MKYCEMHLWQTKFLIREGLKGNAVQNTVAQKLLHYSNLSPSLDSRIGDWSQTAKNIVLIVLDQVAVLNFQLGPELSDENFFGPLYFGMGKNLL